MTKLRPPLSFEDAITRVAALIGWDDAAAHVGRKARALRNLSDPDRPEQISLFDALTLDCAYRLAGGEGAPFHDAYALQLEYALAADDYGNADELARRTIAAAKEGGEAIAALIQVTRPGAKPADRALALREVREGIDALCSTLPMLEAGEAPP